MADGHDQGVHQEPRDGTSRPLPVSTDRYQLFALEHMRDRYWHNMAGRIQRAWRNYMRYKNECATRIQRFWTNKKDGIALAQLRDYGHTVLAGRKERRRFSIISMRKFLGDYLGAGDKTGSGDLLRGAAGIGGEHDAETRDELTSRR